MYFIEVLLISGSKTIIAVSEIIQVFQNEDDDISIALKNGDVIVTADSYEEIKCMLRIMQDRYAKT